MFSVASMKQQTYGISAGAICPSDGCRAYEYMGVHREGDGFVFRVWAPHAQAAFAVGDFNSWGESAPMVRTGADGIWECKISCRDFGQGSLYKFKLKVDGQELYRADPYALMCENGGQGASRFFESSYSPKDGGWLDHRAVSNVPVSIYSVDLSSECRRADGSYSSCADVANTIAHRAKTLGYTHVELNSVFESAPDGGVTGFFAPSSRYGDPDGLYALIDYLHRSGVGVIIGWSPLSFSRHERGLALYDGHPLYGDGSESARFDLSSVFVRSFLISNAIFWVDRYHADGLRVHCTAEITEDAKNLFLCIKEELARSFPGVLFIS